MHLFDLRGKQMFLCSAWAIVKMVQKFPLWFLFLDIDKKNLHSRVTYKILSFCLKRGYFRGKREEELLVGKIPPTNYSRTVKVWVNFIISPQTIGQIPFWSLLRHPRMGPDLLSYPKLVLFSVKISMKKA